MLNCVRAFIREHDLIRVGERVGVAVSGGADSVALLRILLELREDMGIVLAVAHMNHGLRGTEAEQDAEFVAELARAHGLEFHLAERDVGAYAAEHRLSVEAAGRKLRYEFFGKLVRGNLVDKIATAHTLDDQAETVLLKVLRGAWLRGLGGIHEKLVSAEGRTWIVRPLLCITRREIEVYLNALAQPWREDLSNLDLHYTRNRARKLLPVLEEQFNPAVRQALAQTAALARAEEDYWAAETSKLAVGVVRLDGRETCEIDVAGLVVLPLAVQRRIIRYAAEQLGLKLNFEEAERLRTLAQSNAGTKCELTAGWTARKQRTRSRSMLQIVPCMRDQVLPQGYEYSLAVPGEVTIAEAGRRVRAELVRLDAGEDASGLLDAELLGRELVVRNWRPGDRYLAVGEEHEKKLKEHFQRYRIPPERRAMWPVVVSNGRLAWVEGMPIASEFAFRHNRGAAVRIRSIAFAG